MALCQCIVFYTLVPHLRGGEFPYKSGSVKLNM